MGNFNHLPKSQLGVLQNRIRHSIERAKERYDIDLTEKDYFAMISQIVNGKAMWIYKIIDNDERWMYAVTHKEFTLLTVFDMKLGMICTFLPIHHYYRIYQDDAA
jgi:hypothetical protein